MENRASKATACLERAWAMLRGLHPEIPPAVILIYAQHTRQPRQKGGVMLGHFTRQVWRAQGPKKQHEVGVSPYLFSKPAQILNTLLHEAAHAALFELDPRCEIHRAGCSLTDPLYHRTEFRDLCQAWGLQCKFHNRRYGHCNTGWHRNRVDPIYAGVLAMLKRELPPGVEEDPVHHSGPQLFRFSCHCPRNIFVRLPVAAVGGIRCLLCGHEFEQMTPIPP